MDGGQPAQRGAVRELDGPATGELDSRPRPVRVVQRAQQLGRLGRVEQQGRHPPGAQRDPARRGADGQIGRGDRSAAEGGQQQAGPALGPLAGEPVEARPDRPQQAGDVAGGAGVRMGADPEAVHPAGPAPVRHAPVGRGAPGPVHLGVLRPEGEAAVGSPERVQGVHRSGPSGGGGTAGFPA